MTDPSTMENLLERFADAWNAHDIDRIMSCMTDDCVFLASGGSDAEGARIEGQAAVRKSFAEVFEVFADAKWANGKHFVFGDRGLSEWIFTGTLADGKRVEVHGCDLLTFRDGKILIKDSYRKQRPPIA